MCDECPEPGQCKDRDDAAKPYEPADDSQWDHGGR